MLACFIGYIVQAVVNNFTPLLFVNFQTVYGIPLAKITLLITINFLIQLCVDLVSAWLLDRIGYRAGVVFAHVASAAGLIMLTILPELTGDPYIGILISVAFYAIGGGLLEVLISPMIEACPTDNKESAMSLLHSFYCWGHIAIVLLSTGFFALFGTENWRVLTYLWAIIPLVNCVFFFFVPINSYSEGRETESVGGLFRIFDFRLFLLLMICAGACEQAIAQWASLFAEKGLGVSKTVGDLMGPCLFGLMMAITRTLYGAFGARLDLSKVMRIGAVGMIGGFLLTVFSQVPVLSLVGCGIVGLCVGVYWPGTLSLATRALPQGGTSMFAVLALAGDIGCASGPGLIGFVSGRISGGFALNGGILSAVIFPAAAFVLLTIIRGRSANKVTDVHTAK